MEFICNDHPKHERFQGIHFNNCYRHATRGNHCQMTFKLVASLIKPQLRDNLGIFISRARSLLEQKYPTVEVFYNKLWKGREHLIVDLIGSWELREVKWNTHLFANYHIKFHTGYQIQARTEAIDKVWSWYL
jgi:hypothetical protein